MLKTTPKLVTTSIHFWVLLKLPSKMNYDESFSSDQKSVYLNVIQTIVNYKDNWRLLNNLPQALGSLEKLNELNYAMKYSSGFEFMSDDKKTRLVQLIVDVLNNSYEYIKENIIKQNLIIQREELYDLENKYPG